MFVDCHIHMVLDGSDWRASIAHHRSHPREDLIRSTLSHYQALGFSWLRDGGDRWGVGKLAQQLAPEYGICLRTPLAPLHRAGHYGGFIGEKYEDLRDYTQKVINHRESGANFIKIMISGLMDFDQYGVLSEAGLSPSEIHELIHIAHEEGMSVMAHANGADIVTAAALAGVDSVEHGAYLNDEALHAMQEAGTVWVPTLSAIGNLRGKGRFREASVTRILESAMENAQHFSHMGGLLAPGTDAGAWAVPHGSQTEYALLQSALGDRTDAVLRDGIQTIRSRF